MMRQKASVKKQPVVPESPNKSKKKTQGPESSTLEQVKQISQEGKDTHLQSNQTKKAYAGHVRRGCEWLQSIVSGGNDASGSSLEDFKDPEFKHAFEDIPNRFSAKALSLYLSLKGFGQEWGQSTVEGVHAAYKKLWDNA